MSQPLRLVSLFCGLGGWDLGAYRAARELGIAIEVVAAYDSWDRAVACYNANLPHPVAEVRDLKQMQREDLPPHDLVIGGPPCQPFSMAGKRKGHSDERNCLPDFLRLAGDSPFVMENVVPRLINAPFSVKLCAADFGDVTSRRRWFYSNYLLHVIPTPGPRRIRDIRDHAEDERVLRKRCDKTAALAKKAEMAKTNPNVTQSHQPRDDGDFIGMLGAESYANLQGGSTLMTCKAGNHGHYDSLDSLDSLSAHSWHGHDIRGSGKLLLVTHRPRTNEQGCEPYATVAHDDELFGSLTNDAPRAYSGKTLRLGLRGNSASASASAFEDDEVLGSVLSNSFHANEASRIVACRNPSLLEMARAHSIPDSFDWCGATKSDRGRLIANSVPVGMAAGVSHAIFRALLAERCVA